jgi:plastocyanin
MTLNNDGTCGTAPFSWAIGAGTSELELYAQDSTPGMPTLTASATGLDAGVGVLNIDCPSGQRVCPGLACVPATGGCCNDTECTAGGLPWVCNSNSHLCEPPPCSFPASCTFQTYVDRTAAGASRTVTFDSSGYTPKCMRVTTSQDVTFSGSFGTHPLQQTCGPSNRQMTTTNGVTKVVRFPQFGEYGYRCANHPAFVIDLRLVAERQFLTLDCTAQAIGQV